MKPIVTTLMGSLLILAGIAVSRAADGPSGPQVLVGVFDVDASPPIGSPLAYDPATAVETPLRCRGNVILGTGKPVVLCAVDWIDISTAGRRFFASSWRKRRGHRPSASWCTCSTTRRTSEGKDRHRIVRGKRGATHRRPEKETNQGSASFLLPTASARPRRSEMTHPLPTVMTELDRTRTPIRVEAAGHVQAVALMVWRDGS
jgi:hypothetical protein